MARKHESRDRGKPAFALLDEAVHLMRTTPVRVHLLYYVGALPFVAGLLNFWATMSYSAHAYAQLPGAALLMAVLFLWMKAWQARHAALLWAGHEGQPPAPWGVRGFLGTFARQGAIHATAVVLLPLAVVLLIPAAWVYAAYQNATVLDGCNPEGTRDLVRRALREAKRWPRQNHIVIWMLSPLLVCFLSVLLFLLMPVIEGTAEQWAVVVLWSYVSLFTLIAVLLCPVGTLTYANLFAGILAALYLSHTLLGLDTFFSRSPVSILGSPFYVLVGGLTYLALDPFVKAAYVLRCFHARALADGTDLRLWLARLKAGRAASLALALILICTGFAATAQDQPAAPAASSSRSGAVALDAALDAELAKPRYAWRMPRVEVPKDEQSFMGRFFTWFAEESKQLRDKIKAFVKKLFDWLDRQFRMGGGGGENGALSRISIGLKVLAATLVALLVVALFLYLRRALQKRALDAAPVAAVAPATPDIEDEATQADALPEDDWLALARRYAESGDHRLGMRALYLAILAHLARHEFIRIARHKTNLDYRRELAGRMPVDAQHQRAFAECTLLYECVWYGEHPAGPEQFAQLHRYQHYLRFDPPATRASLREASAHA